MPLDSKHPEAIFSPTSTDSLYFQVAEVPKSQDLAISRGRRQQQQRHDRLLYPLRMHMG